MRKVFFQTDSCLSIIIKFIKRWVIPMLISSSVVAQSPVQQQSIRLVASMPNMPQTYKMKSWKEITLKQDSLLYNFQAKGRFLPLIWWDTNHVNFPDTAFGIPSYVGSLQWFEKGSDYESLPVMGSLISASLLGVDKMDYNGHDFVSMCRQFYNTANGVDLIMNSVSRLPGETFWYEIFPGMAYSMLVDLYPENDKLADIMLLNAGHWLVAVNGLSKGRSYPDFNYTSYNFLTQKGVYNGKWHEPDAAAGLAWLEFAAWKKSGQHRFLKGALSCLEYLQNRPAKQGPYYELMLPYGAYLSIRLNAEMGTHYDELKFLNWCFDGNNSDRDGWGVVQGKWGKYDVDGLVGQTKEEQYAFAMNTFSQAGALAPIVKYNAAYARTIGKWLLNLASASRLFYADEHPANQQSSALWQGDPEHLICYEGLRKDLDHGNHFQVYKGILSSEGPYAIGDQVKTLNAFTDICPYGSSWVGMLGAIIDTTNVPGILLINCNATDFFSDKAYKSYLIYNPYRDSKDVQVSVGEKSVNVYDRVSRSYLARNVRGKVQIRLKADAAVSLALVPANIKATHKGHQLSVAGHVIDYNYLSH